MGEDSLANDLVTVSSSCHQNQLVSGLWNFFSSQHMVDFEFALGSHFSIEAHQLVLEIFLSPDALNRMTATAEATQEERKPEEADNLYALLEFIYRGTVTVHRERLSRLLDAARRLNFRMLEDAILSVREDRTESPLGIVISNVKSCQSNTVCSGDDSGGQSSGSKVDEALYELLELVDEELSDDSSGSHFRGSKSKDSVDSDGSDWLPPSQASERAQNSKFVAQAKNASVCKAPTTKHPKLTTVVARRARRTPIVTAVSLRTYCCKQCECQFSRWSAFYHHVMVEHRTNTLGEPLPPSAIPGVRTYPCTLCDFRAAKWSALYQHVTAKHGKNTLGEPIKRFKCPDCSYTCLHQTRLKYHRVKHSSEKPFRCQHCPYAASLIYGLKKHISLIHPDTLPEPQVQCLMECKHCGKMIKNTSMRQHLHDMHFIKSNGKLIKKRYECPDCPFVAVNPSKLGYHRNTKHSTEKPFKCPHCSYATSRKGSVNLHIRMVHQRQRNIMCDTCGMRMSNQSQLVRHMACHSDERAFKCETCGRCFRHESTYRRHAKLHLSNERPFVCEVCGRAFNRNSNLRVHVKNVHRIRCKSEVVDEPESGSK